MQDLYGRTISYLRISITDLCNYRCGYCMPAEGVVKHSHSDICSLEELRDMARMAVQCGIEKIRVTGGEPLVRRGVVDFCRMLRGIDGLKELCVTTNGSLLNEMALPLKKAGVDRLNISLDTLKPQRFREITRNGSLEDVLNGIEAAEKAGFEHLKINCVLLGDINDDEIEDFVHLTKDHPWEVRFIERMPMGNGLDFGTYIPAQTVLDGCPSLIKLENKGVASLYRLPDGIGTIGLITPMSHEFCSTCSRLRITADGKLKSCLHSDKEIPLRGLKGEALRDAIVEGIRKKPPQHHLNEEGRTETHRTMNRIGG